MPKHPQLGASGNPGQRAPATDELYLRPVRPNPDPRTTAHPVTPRGYSTTRSFSVGDAQGERLIPQVVDGFLLTERDAIRHADRTGRHLGRFDTPAHADQAAKRIHELQELHGDLLAGSRRLSAEEHARRRATRPITRTLRRSR